MTSSTSSAQSDPNREIVSTRIFNAPRELVWETWVDPRHISHWWGPRGFSTTTHEMNVRPGGVWRFVMHAADGTDFDNRIVYSEVTKPERLVYSHGKDNDVDPDKFQVVVTFEDLGSRTKVTLRSILPSVEACNAAKKFGAIEGAQQTLDRFSERLATTAAGDAELVIAREFAAPRALVWKAFTEADSLAQWWGPKGFTIRVTKMELRPGGVFHYCMQGGGGEMWGKFVYREIAPFERIVFVNSFANEQGDTVPVPFAGGWPTEMLNTWTFTEKGEKTLLTLRSVPFNTASDAERKTFKDGHSSMQQGFGGTFDQLSAFLEER